MRQSLSERPHVVGVPPRTAPPLSGTALAILGALALVVVGVADQLGGRSLVEHARDVYAPHGEDVSAGLLYGLVYTVGAVSALLWLVVLRSARRGNRWAAVVAGVAVVVGLGLAATLLGAQEYGERILPAVWGVLALLSPAAGVLAVVQLVLSRLRARG